jgi:hypothetical protein
MRGTAASNTFHFLQAPGGLSKPAPILRKGIPRSRRTGPKVLSTRTIGRFLTRITCHKSQFGHICPLYGPKAAKNGEILSYTH